MMGTTTSTESSAVTTGDQRPEVDAWVNATAASFAECVLDAAATHLAEKLRSPEILAALTSDMRRELRDALRKALTLYGSPVVKPLSNEDGVVP